MRFLASPVVNTAFDHGNGHPWWPIFPILWFLFIAGVIACCVVAGRRRRRLAPGLAGESKLAERYAAGEIDEQEYRQRLAVLREQR